MFNVINGYIIIFIIAPFITIITIIFAIVISITVTIITIIIGRGVCPACVCDKNTDRRTRARAKVIFTTIVDVYFYYYQHRLHSICCISRNRRASSQARVCVWTDANAIVHLLID